MNENLFIYFQILVHEMSPLHSMLRIHRGSEIMVFPLYILQNSL